MPDDYPYFEIEQQAAGDTFPLPGRCCAKDSSAGPQWQA
jgi:hypothetical protein